ncbi:MAG: hypothetical protein LQ348_006583 [Seirophora lacunosa]|nr:MAG: hypothetical protein LQ348_006583 [Seirophora lacunosa]
MQDELIPVEDTKSDIALYLEANISHLPSLNLEHRRVMMDKILAKLAGCFLDAISLSTTLQEVDIDDAVDKPWITGLAYQVSGEAFFWGKEDRSIHAYEANTGRHIHKLLSHAEGLSVTTLSIDEEGSALLSADSSSRIIVHRLVRQHKSWIVGTASFHHRIGRSVHPILSNRGNTRLLVASATCDTLWSMSSDAYETIDTIQREEMGVPK